MFSVKMESQQKKRRRIAFATPRRILVQFFCQPHSDLHAVDEAGAFVVTAEGADRIHDLIHLPQWHAIHRFVQLLECVQECLVEFGVPLEQFFYQRLFRLLTLQGDSLCHMGLDSCGDIFHKTHLQEVSGVLT